MSHTFIVNKIIKPELPVFDKYSKKIHQLLKKHHFVLAKRDIYKYNLAVDYSVCHYSEDYRTLKKIVHELYPQYDNSFFYVFECNNKLSHYNIFLTYKSIFNDYCKWLFSILFEAEKRINISLYQDYQKRVFGYFGERLLNVYIYHNKFIVKHKPLLFISNTEKNTPLVDFFRNIRNQCSFFFQYFSIYNFLHKQ
jgi:hypothetical protein